MSDFEFLGPYRIEAKLGQGGMGTVYRGVHAKSGQRVAIKVLASQMSSEPRFRRRFDAEIETLKRLNHPNIVRLIGFGEEQGQLFFSMELVEGPSLLEHLRKVKRLDWDTTIGFAIEICSALKHAHDIGVIHRDLKPANLLLEPEGRIKLTDFGIAKLFGANEQTAAGSVLGTADYMAPEQAMGGPVTPRTDLYALGSLMYACLVGRPPFGGRNLTQVVYGLKHETPAPLDLVLPDVPAELAELVHELLEKAPEDRPPTALAVGKRLGALRAGLRRRGEQTHIDLGAPTLPEVEIFPNVPSGKKRSQQPVDANHPTAAEDGADIATGAEIGLAPTLSSNIWNQGTQSSQVATDDEPTVPRTHFETVPGGPATGGNWHSSAPPHGESKQWVSILGLSVMLVAALGIVLWMLRDPTAADLIARVEQAEANGNRRELESAVEAFLRIYPSDSRADSLRESLVIGDIDQMARRLRVHATQVGGVDHLEPAEQSWLAAIEIRETNPPQAMRQLQSWLDIFGHIEASRSGPGSDTTTRLAELTSVEVERLKQSTEVAADPRAVALDEWIDWGLTHLEGESRERFVTGIRALYSDSTWAAAPMKKLP